jgi:hypothetical protein
LYSFSIRPGLYRPAGKLDGSSAFAFKARGANAAIAGAAAARCKNALRFIFFTRTVRYERFRTQGAFGTGILETAVNGAAVHVSPTGA